MDPITSNFVTDTAPSASPSKTKTNDSQNQFLQLLVAQLKGQDPLNPADGTAFVAQLAQFSSLEELTKIRASMDSVKQYLANSAASSNQPGSPSDASDKTAAN